MLVQAVDSGRRSGHGRVVYRFYDLCEKIWGGSPATERIDPDVETCELEDLTQARDLIYIEESSTVEPKHHEQSSGQQANSKSDQPANSKRDQPANNDFDQPANSGSEKQAYRV